ncbi:MAG TPA: transglutaminase family protein [Opitutaceae bacterium]|nr:transglutaminase family protein [Opitutaceae bacterium]
MPDSTTPTAAEPALAAGQRIRVRHLTRFLYHGPVTDSFNEVRLKPLSDDMQACVAFDLRLDPAATLREYDDFHKNRAHYFDIVGAHAQLDIEAISVVETHADTRPLPLAPFSPALLDDAAVGVEHFDFLADTAYVPLAVPLRHEVKQILGDTVRDLWADAVRLGEHVHDLLVYTPNATKVNTRVVDVLESRRGVCQDYAHLMLGLCRSAGIPARYVSGYFLNPMRKESDIEASHAWVEIFLPGYGWRGYDPTHRRLPGTNYVKLARGRDYGDIRPVSGTFRGLGTREMIVEVQVRAG